LPNPGTNEPSDAADLGSLIIHSISGKDIQEIYHDQNTLINVQRIPLASFKNFKKTETLQLTTIPNPGSEYHSCICVMYKPRKVNKVTLSVFRFYSLQGRRWTGDLQTSVLRRWDERLLLTIRSTTLLALFIFLFIIWIVGVTLILQKLKQTLRTISSRSRVFDIIVPQNASFDTSPIKNDSQL